MVREWRPAGSRSVDLLVGASFDDDDVDPRQRQLARQHQPGRTASCDHHRCSVIAAPRRTLPTGQARPPREPVSDHLQSRDSYPPTSRYSASGDDVGLRLRTRPETDSTRVATRLFRSRVRAPSTQSSRIWQGPHVPPKGAAMSSEQDLQTQARSDLIVNRARRLRRPEWVVVDP